MSNDLTKNQKLLVGVGVLIMAGFFFNGKLYNKSTKPKAKVTTESKLASVIVDGDADSAVDMARRLNKTAREAVDAAQSAQAKTNEYQVATAEKIDALINSIDADKKRNDKRVRSGLSDIKTELNNFKQLVTGQLQATAKQSNQAAPQAPVAGWTKIGPVNILPETYSGPRTDVTSVDGRVPKRGNVFEPFNFFVQTGSDNWTSQDHQIPFLERAIWRGVATGDKDLQCIRGSLTSVTFVFSDETIQTVSGTKDKPLAELVTTTGSNCIPGEYVSNTRKYLAAYGMSGALTGLGEGIADNETITSLTDSGRIISAVNGRTGNFLAGRALSASASKAAEIIDEEYESSFASVVLQAGVDVNMIALKQIDIDHDAAGRKVTYLDPSYQ